MSTNRTAFASYVSMILAVFVGGDAVAMNTQSIALWLLAGLGVLAVAGGLIWGLVRLAGARPARLLPRDHHTPSGM